MLLVQFTRNNKNSHIIQIDLDKYEWGKNEVFLPTPSFALNLIFFFWNQNWHVAEFLLNHLFNFQPLNIFGLGSKNFQGFTFLTN